MFIVTVQNIKAIQIGTSGYSILKVITSFNATANFERNCGRFLDSVTKEQPVTKSVLQLNTRHVTLF